MLESYASIKDYHDRQDLSSRVTTNDGDTEPVSGLDGRPEWDTETDVAFACS